MGRRSVNPGTTVNSVRDHRKNRSTKKMELRHLRYFCAVAENRGFSRTARALHVSQSAISEQIADLEREVGAPLLLRGRQKVGLTPHGEVFLAEARKVLAGADYAVEMAQRSYRGEVGTLRIGF